MMTSVFLLNTMSLHHYFPHLVNIWGLPQVNQGSTLNIRVAKECIKVADSGFYERRYVCPCKLHVYKNWILRKLMEHKCFSYCFIFNFNTVWLRGAGAKWRDDPFWFRLCNTSHVALIVNTFPLIIQGKERETPDSVYISWALLY